MAKTRSGKPVVIVEIGSDWLKMAQVEPQRDGVSISKMHLEKFDGLGGKLSQSLSKASRKLKFAGSPVIVCLPRQMVNIRMLELPSTEPDEVRDMVDLQAGKQTPYSKEEIVSDYRIIGSGREGYTKVMLAIVQRSIVRQRFHILEEAGIEAERMTVSSEGLMNWYRHAVSDEGSGAAALLDIDSFYSDFMVIADGGPVFTRSILVGANQLLGEYEKWKEKFIREVKRSLEICQGESPGLSIAKLFITGAGLNIKDLGSYLGGQLEIAVEERDCLRNVKKLPKKPSVRDAAYHAVSLTPLVGIALAPDNLEFNLTPDSVKLRKGLVTKARSLTVLGMLVMTALISVSMYTTLKLYFEKNRLDSLSREIRETDPAVRKVEKMREIIRAVDNHRNPKFAAINLLAEIPPLVPHDVYFDVINFDAEKEEIRLEGSSVSRGEISRLIKSLERSSLFRDVKQEGDTTMDPKSKRYRFLVVCALEKQE